MVFFSSCCVCGCIDRPRFYWMTTSDGHNDLQWREYEIDGDVLDFNDWRLTGATIDIPKE